MADRTPVIAGIALSDYPKAPDLDGTDHHVQAMQRVLEDSGLPKQDIDGYMTVSADGFAGAVQLAEYLGINHRYIDGTMTGGSSFEFLVQHGAAAIKDNICDTILITYGSDQLSKMGRMLGTGGFHRAGAKVAGPMQFEAPYGNTLVGNYALAAQRHMHEFGTTSEQLAEIAVAMRAHAAANPMAQYRDPITVDDVLSSRMIADPLHMLDCCVISDGGAACVVTTEERARDLQRPAVYVLGAAHALTHHMNVSQMPELTVTAAAQSGPLAFGRAGITPSDVDTLQVYDSFTITVLLSLEDLGFCAKGEGGAFVESERLQVGGALPTNTDGGGLSACHPGMRGMFLIVEAVRQLRGESGPRQVPNAKTACVSGTGGWFCSSGTMILAVG